MFYVFLVGLSKATLRCNTSICDGIINGNGNVADIVCLVETVLPLPLLLVIVPKLMVMVIVMVLCAKLRQGLLDG